MKTRKSRAKYTLSSEFERVFGILGKVVSIAVMRDVFQALYPENAELQERIRSCEICDFMFWARYKNSVACSQVCLNALSQRRHREINKDAINSKRREDYQNRATLKGEK